MAAAICPACQEQLAVGVQFCITCGAEVEYFTAVSLSEPRRYDLDALRGFAMLLGIVLHAAIPFIPYWTKGDSGGELLMVVVGCIHGFRMPLFFMLSGFFTTMLWRRRGLQDVVKHRLRRVALPLLAGVFTVLPLVWAGWIGGYIISGTDVDYDQTAEHYAQEINGEQLSSEIKDNGEGEDVRKPASEESENTFGFAHMWFLWFLLWMLPGFTIITAAAGWFGRKRGGDRLIPSPIVTVILCTIPFLTFIPQNNMNMGEPTFGAALSDTIIPNWDVLCYYVCFFAFGALVYDRRNGEGRPLIESLGRYWFVQLTVGLLLLFPLGLWLIGENRELASLLQVAFAWMASFGLIGLFHQVMSGGNFRVRWLSDASYWMYLLHLPLVFVAQGIVARFPTHALINFVFICGIVTPLLLLSYRYLVRYSFVGTLLNGARTRGADDAERVKLSAANAGQR